MVQIILLTAPKSFKEGKELQKVNLDTSQMTRPRIMEFNTLISKEVLCLLL
jgi:hypothetical protein